MVSITDAYIERWEQIFNLKTPFFAKLPFSLLGLFRLRPLKISRHCFVFVFVFLVELGMFRLRPLKISRHYFVFVFVFVVLVELGLFG